MGRTTGSWKCNVTGARYVSMYLKWKHLLVRCIFRHVRHGLSSMLVVPQTVSDIGETIINVMAENFWEVRFVSQNISLNILIVKGIMGSYLTIHFYWSKKLTVKIISNKNTTSAIHSKRWHLSALMLKKISNYLYVYFAVTIYWVFTNYCSYVIIQF